MVRSVLLAATGAVLALAACAPKPVPEPKPSDDFAAADKAFVDETTGKIAKSFERPEEVLFRNPVISRSKRGKALCVDAAEPEQAWTAMIAVKTPGAAGYVIHRSGDNLSAKARKQCPALVLKYMDEPKADWYEAEVAINQAGCAHLDPRYWRAWKKYCNGELTKPAAKPAPAA
ncbi:MAG: hypothetical protein QM608_21325 [Caulobacter sp.]